MKTQIAKHLEFVQKIIARMNTNSFQIKGWTAGLVSAIATLASASQKNELFVVVLLPICLFWCLDASYLQKERKFIGIYNTICKQKEGTTIFEMHPEHYKDGRYSFFSCFFSHTLLLFYAGITVLTTAIYALVEAIH